MAWKISEAAAVLVLSAASLAAQDTPASSGPLGLIIQYKCAPGQRVAFWHSLEALAKRISVEGETGSAKGRPSELDRMRDTGAIREFHLLFSRYVDTNAWDAMALIVFRDYSAVQQWKEVERIEPGGLAPGVASLAASIETYPVDMVRSAGGGDSLKEPVYFVIPYTFTVTAAAYQKYADDYVIPQFKGWIREGILSDFQMYMQRYTAGRPWDTMIFLRYKDDASFGRREETVAKVRAELASNPVWKAVSDNKQSVRVEKEAIIADDLAAAK